MVSENTPDTQVVSNKHSSQGPAHPKHESSGTAVPADGRSRSPGPDPERGGARPAVGLSQAVEAVRRREEDQRRAQEQHLQRLQAKAHARREEEEK